MKSVLCAVAFVSCFVGTASADTYVNGYYRNDGTYVQPHYRSSPNSSEYDNWSTKGNVNPYTGQVGTREPSYNSISPSYGGYNSGSSGSGINLNPYRSPTNCTGLLC